MVSSIVFESKVGGVAAAGSRGGSGSSDRANKLRFMGRATDSRSRLPVR